MEEGVTHVIKEFGSRVPLDIMSVEIAPAKLNIDPVLVARRAIQHVFVLYRTD